MTVQEAHSRVRLQLNKELVGYVTPGDIDRALDRAQLAEFFDLHGNFQEYQPGRPIPRKSYGVTQKISEDLAPFREWISFTADNFDLVTERYGTGPDGVLVLPDDYIHYTGLYDSTNSYIEIVDEDEIALRLDNSIIAPSADYPAGVLGGTGGTVNGVDIETRRKIQLFPESPIAGKLWYLRRPAKPVYSFTQSGRTITFDSETSTDPEWGDIAMERIINRTCSILGEHLQDQMSVQYGEMKTDKGL